ncbi:MAG: citrate synthase [Candidatus Omnitrophica bacterium]|nr:citrate synthase [Candidatus Omnitrophota bacterium]
MKNYTKLGHAELKVLGKTVKLPLYGGTEDEKGIDISQLREQTACITLDPGYANTGSCTSGITFIDGEKGILRYRGYAIEDLAKNASFLEVAYLLIYGELPNPTQLSAFVNKITRRSMIPEGMKRFFHGYPESAHPMSILSAMICSLSAYYPDCIHNHPETMDLNICRIIAKIPSIAAFSYKQSIGQPIIEPMNKLNYTENFLRMMFAVPTEEYDVDPVAARALEMILILHADHEQNCSTSTVRIAGSSQANLYASISAGICALWGYLHGGANQAVIDMLRQIRNDGGDVKKFIRQVKDKKSGVRLMGFGHRVYKNYDPRASILKKACDDVLAKVGTDGRPLLDIAKKLENAALHDDYFVERKLYPNVDFYSGIILRGIGIPSDMFTVIFAIGRLPGWIAQWLEMRESPTFRIARPRQIYTGNNLRKYVPLKKRETLSKKVASILKIKGEPKAKEKVEWSRQ